MEVDDTKRYDVFISFHGGEEHTGIKHPFQTRQVIDYAVRLLRRLAEEQQKVPSIFFDGKEVRETISDDIIRSLLQTRAGGLGFCVLTREYFRRPWCVFELEALRKLKAEQDSNMKIRFLCLGCTADDILGDQLVQTVVPDLGQIVLHSLEHVRTKQEAADEIARRVWSAWVEEYPHPNVDSLGESRSDSFSCMQKIFRSQHVPTLRSSFGLRALFMADVGFTFDEAVENGQVSETNLRNLEAANTRIGQPGLQQRRNAIAAYKHKWIDSDRLDWGYQAREELENLFQNVKTRVHDAII